MTKDETLYIRVNKETKEGAELLAGKLGINVSQLVRMLINNSLTGNVITIDGATALERSWINKGKSPVKTVKVKKGKITEKV